MYFLSRKQNTVNKYKYNRTHSIAQQTTQKHDTSYLKANFRYRNIRLRNTANRDTMILKFISHFSYQSKHQFVRCPNQVNQNRCYKHHNRTWSPTQWSPSIQHITAVELTTILTGHIKTVPFRAIQCVI